jgi:hypothetical protein
MDTSKKYLLKTAHPSPAKTTAPKGWESVEPTPPEGSSGLAVFRARIAWKTAQRKADAAQGEAKEAYKKYRLTRHKAELAASRRSK